VPLRGVGSALVGATLIWEPTGTGKDHQMWLADFRNASHGTFRPSEWRRPPLSFARLNPRRLNL
jgi:hypothetical protein